MKLLLTFLKKADPTLISIMKWLLVLLSVSLCKVKVNATCNLPFEGFGVYLGSVGHLGSSPKGTAQKVVDRVYSDLGIRHFRTSYEAEFSKSKNTYIISCAVSNITCLWIEIAETVAKYPNVTVFASIWSPPHYMKNDLFDTLPQEHEQDYYYFIKNITSIVKSQFGLEIEKVSPVNEPENLFAPWDHTNMGPNQLCRMVKQFSDPLISLCPENSYFWMTELYSNYTDKGTGVDCSVSCEILATHAYTLNIDIWSPFHLLAYYDPGRYVRHTQKPIWMTEVSSTFPLDQTIPNQIKEGLDLAANIVNFLGTTCVQRYYYWYMYTRGSSGESLIWGQENSTENSVPTFELTFPKKYFIFRHFSLASFGEPKFVTECEIVLSQIREGNHENNTNAERNQLCLQFVAEGQDNLNTNLNSSLVLVNKEDNHFKLEGVHCTTPFCCTTAEFDWFCVQLDINDDLVLPNKAVCSCTFESGSYTSNEIDDSVHTGNYHGMGGDDTNFRIRINASILLNNVN